MFRSSLKSFIPKRNLQITKPKLSNLKNWSFAFNIIAGAYIGGLIVSCGSLYFLYSDANKRQPIPWELSFEDKVQTVKAINKDDVLKSPRYSVKHYKQLLLNLYKENVNDDIMVDGYDVPIISDQQLLKKSTKFANFYIDIVLRYSKALLAKGEIETSIVILKKIINDDFIFNNLADAEKLSFGCRLLSKISNDKREKFEILHQAVKMLSDTFQFQVDKNYNLLESSKISDELLYCLNDLAFQLAKDNKLTESLQIYLCNLKYIQNIKNQLDNQTKSQLNYPLFNCDRENIVLQIASLKAHISEILFVKNYKSKAIDLSKEIIDEIQFDYNSSSKVSPILIEVLNNLKLMYEKTSNNSEAQNCQAMIDKLPIYEGDSNKTWYDQMISKWSKIIYARGPLGIIEKPLKERYGPKTRIKELEELEDEDELV